MWVEYDLLVKVARKSTFEKTVVYASDNRLSTSPSCHASVRDVAQLH